VDYTFWSGGNVRSYSDKNQQRRMTLSLSIFFAAAQLLDDAIVRDGLTDHSAEILGLEVGQVNECREVARLSTMVDVISRLRSEPPQ
jgi:hypothetical protein